MTPFEFGMLVGGAKQANALATVAKPLVGEIIRRPGIRATVVPQAAQAGSNAMKYLGAGAAGLAGGVIGSKLMGGNKQQQPPVKAAFAPMQPQFPGAAQTSIVSQQKTQAPFGAGWQNQKVNMGGMLGQLNTMTDKLKTLNPAQTTIAAPKPAGPQPGTAY